MLNRDIIKQTAIGMGVLTAGVLCPAVTGAALIGGSIMAALDNSESMQAMLEKGFEACRLGVLKKNGNIKFPKLVKKIKRPYGWRFIYTIPEGLSIVHFLERKIALQTATNPDRVMEEDGYLHVRALTHRLPRKIWFRPFDTGVHDFAIPVDIRGAVWKHDLKTFLIFLLVERQGGKSILTWIDRHYAIKTCRCTLLSKEN